MKKLIKYVIFSLIVVCLIYGATAEQFVDIVYTDGSYSRWQISENSVSVYANDGWKNYKIKD